MTKSQEKARVNYSQLDARSQKQIAEMIKNKTVEVNYDEANENYVALIGRKNEAEGQGSKEELKNEKEELLQSF